MRDEVQMSVYGIVLNKGRRKTRRLGVIKWIKFAVLLARKLRGKEKGCISSASVTPDKEGTPSRRYFVRAAIQNGYL